LRQEGLLLAARAQYEALLAIYADHLQATLELGQVLVELKQPNAASILFQGAIARHPTDPSLRLALGVALMEMGEPRPATAVFLKASRLAPERLSPRIMLAKSLMACSRHAEALSVMQQTSEIFAETAEVWALRGAAERSLNDNAAAEISYRRQLELEPNDFNALNNLGVALRALGRMGDAVSLYQQALVSSPNSSLVHANLGNALDALGKANEAERHLRAAVKLDPSSIDARYNLGAHLVREEKPEEAIAHLRFVVGVAPQRWDAWTNLGVALVAMGEMIEPEKCYRTAIQLRPSTPEPHYNLAWLLLLTGRWREGWNEYEWRWQLPQFSSRPYCGAAPKWDGSFQPNATILLICEQGLGDSIQFVRFAALVRERCARVIVECPKSLMQIFRGVAGIDETFPHEGTRPHHDFYAPLLSVPGLLGITPEVLSAGSAYLNAPREEVNHLRIPNSGRPKIGFVWAGSPDNKIDRRRSCDVDHFEKLFQGLDVELVSLQTGPRAHDLAPKQISFQIDGLVTDWAQTASVVRQLDLVIGVDTAVMHLAGALGTPAWLLIPASPDFRWLLERADTPWYSSISLFRQRVRGDWTGLFKDLRSALTIWLQNRA